MLLINANQISDKNFDVAVGHEIRYSRKHPENHMMKGCIVNVMDQGYLRL